MAYQADDQIVRDAVASDGWVPANGGSEAPILLASGDRLLYCWHPASGRHAYLDMRSDVILADDQAFAILTGRV